MAIFVFILSLRPTFKNSVLLAKKIISQSTVYFLGSVFSVAFGFFFKIYLANILGADLLGVFSLGMTAVAIAGVFSSLGYVEGLVRFVSKYVALDDFPSLFSYLKNTLVITSVLASSFCLVFVFFPSFIGEQLLTSEDVVAYIPAFGLMLLVSCFMSIADQCVRGLQEVSKSSIISNFIRLPFKAILTVCLFYVGYGLEGYIWAEIFACALSLVLMYLLIRKILPKGGVSKIFSSKEKLKDDEKEFSKNILIINSTILLQNHGDKLLVAAFLSTTELGVYSVILSIAVFVPTVLVSVNSIFSPIISQLSTQQKTEELGAQYQNTSRYIFILSFPLVVFILLFRENILGLFGDDFVVGSGLLVLVMLAEVINFAFGSVSMMLKMAGYEKQMKYLSVFSSVAAFSLVALCLPQHGFIAVGYGYILGRLLLNLGGALILRNKTGIFVFNKKYLSTITFYLGLSLAVFFGYNGLALEPGNGYAFILFLLAIYLVFIFLWYVFYGRKEVPKIISLLKNKNV